MMSAPEARTSSGRIAFTFAAVPTGMEVVVRISPAFIALSPVLATPSFACVTKLKRVIATERLTDCAAGAIQGPAVGTKGLLQEFGPWDVEHSEFQVAGFHR